MRIQFYALSIFGVVMWCLIFMRLQGGFVDMKENAANVVKNMRGVRKNTLLSVTPKKDIDVAVFVLSRRSAFSTRKVIRNTWARGHDNVFFVVGACCLIPPQHRKEWTCERAKASSSSEQVQWNKKCMAQDTNLAVENSTHGDMLFMHEVDVYRHLPQKVKFCYEWGVNHTNANWFVKTDDDSVVRVGTLEKYLKNTYDEHKYTIIGYIADKWGVPRGGKWAENNYKPNKYPKFPLGSVGHVVSRPVADYIKRNANNLFNYQGEDVSMGIWMDESPMRSNITWVNSKHMSNHGRCTDKSIWVIGHNIKPETMERCFKHNDEVDVYDIIN